MSNLAFTLEDILHPIKTKDFLNNFWENKPLFVSRNTSNYYENLLSLKDVDTLIKLSDWHEIKLANKNNPESINHLYLSRLIQDRSLIDLYNLYAQKATIIVNNINRYWYPLSLLSRQLEKSFSCSVNVNLYMTPKGAQGFDIHYDSHDVFILQIEGQKKWQLYQNNFSPLPLASDEDNKSLPLDLIGDPIQTLILQPGDLLYIPRGYPHEAFTSEENSLHLTVGIGVWRWLDLIGQALVAVAKEEISLRKSLPLDIVNYQKDPLVEKQFQEILKFCLEKAQFSEAVNQLSKDFIEALAPLPDGHFTQLDHLDKIDVNTVVKKRTGMLCHISKKHRSVILIFPGNPGIKCPEKIESALHFIVERDSFTVAELPNMSDHSKIVLVRRLIQEGFLKVSPV